MDLSDDTRPAVVRACAACRARRPATELLRFVRTGASAVLADPARRAPGRGLNLCPTRACLERALKRQAFKRGLRVAAPSGDELAEAAVAAAMASLRAAIVGGRRSHSVHSATLETLDPGDLRVACEAHGLAPVQISDRALHKRVQWLARVVSEFTLPKAGGMNRRPKGAPTPPGPRGTPERRPAKGSRRARQHSENA